MAVSMRESETESLMPVETTECTGDDSKDQYVCDSFWLCIPNSWVYTKTAVDNSPFSTVVLLLNNMIGSGILVQAYVFKESGIISVIVEYIIIGFMTYGGIALLIMSADNVQIFEYSELAHRAMGWPGEKLVDVRLENSNFFHFCEF